MICFVTVLSHDAASHYYVTKGHWNNGILKKQIVFLFFACAMNFALLRLNCSVLSGQLFLSKVEIWFILAIWKKILYRDLYSSRKVSGRHILPVFKAVLREFLYDELNREMINNQGQRGLKTWGELIVLSFKGKFVLRWGCPEVGVDSVLKKAPLFVSEPVVQLGLWVQKKYFFKVCLCIIETNRCPLASQTTLGHVSVRSSSRRGDCWTRTNYGFLDDRKKVEGAF